MCKTTLTHFNCLCTALVVHSCALNFPLGRMVCGPPNLIKKDIYVYSDCDDCLLGAPVREEKRNRLAKKASERWMEIVEDVLDDGDEDVEGVEEIRLECEDERTGDEGEGEVYDRGKDCERDMEEEWEILIDRQKNKDGYQEESEDDEAQLLAAQGSIQSELENPEDDPDENDDLAAAAQLLSALKQELGKDDMVSQDVDIDESEEGKEDGDNNEHQGHVETILESLGKLRDRSERVEVDSTDAGRNDWGL
ncbi:uncharacterized protein EAF01_003107 [Botrytis porri]|uniref:Uncharacterized protein n=1 Tax=Botrytis porri TaxID=87229 RepID=A0A4Z1KPD4_9HELO|nr:uncharacterized protein EAF01_003107 [Botrytis porri]KAF7909389.1 hypothetical protein EAF01_003107 [Botrytis porri]TGO87861.1 hypothetical protein BPOR_0199g00120 [Botrytis porri]